MSQVRTYSNLNDGITSRYYTGFPLNSTLVSSYTPDTIRSIISQAATKQPYSTAVWIRVNPSSVQISAQDPEVSRTRIPVSIPMSLAHDIFMLPTINNVICIVYDEPQSNMKGVLLYVIYPSDAQAIRDDFRAAKQGINNQQQLQPYVSTYDNRYQNRVDIQPVETIQTYIPGSNTQRGYRPTPQLSSKRLAYVRENDTYSNRNLTSNALPITYAPYRSDYHSEREDRHRRHKSSRRYRTENSSGKRLSDSGIKQSSKPRSYSPEKRAKLGSPMNMTQEQIQQQQLLMQQQQQQMAAWQSQQQQPMIPIGIYNRYVPKAIPLPTGETIKTTLPPGANGATTNGTAVTYIVSHPAANASPSGSHSPRQQNHAAASSHRHRRHTPVNNTHTPSQPNSTAHVSEYQARARNTPSANNDEDTKQYVKTLVDEMQAMKVEMDRLRQTSGGTSKGRSDSIRVDLRELRSHIEHIRTRMGLTPTIPED
jgi:hypothetical protein